VFFFFDIVSAATQAVDVMSCCLLSTSCLWNTTGASSALQVVNRREAVTTRTLFQATAEVTDK
jgi:hypothetical protein